jgi:uncharacterized protein
MLPPIIAIDHLRPTVRHYAKLLRTTLTAALVLVALAGAAVAGPFEDGGAAFARGDYATAMRLWRPLAEQGDALAQSNLGQMYSRGQGVPQDYAAAASWYRKAADQGDAFAQYNLGIMYANGRGAPQNYALAVEWYRKAADQGLADAQFNLGDLYYSGRGVPQDNVMAYMWFDLAAAQGKENAGSNRDLWVAKRMTVKQIAEAQKLAHEWKPKKKEEGGPISAH